MSSIQSTFAIPIAAASIALCSVSVAQQGPQTEPIPVPRGPNIHEIAGNCGIGPFEQTAKAGSYNQYCNVLTDAEKCLALIKQHVSYVGELEKARHPEIAQYCLEVFRKGLL